MRRLVFTSNLTGVALVAAFGLALFVSLAVDDEGREALTELSAPAAEAAEGHADDSHADDSHADVDPHAHPLESHGEEGAHATHGGDHGGGHGDDHGGLPHLPSFVDVITGAMTDDHGELSAAGKALKRFKPTIFGVLTAILLALVSQAATRNMTLVPGKLQNVFEAIFGGLADFIQSILGDEYARRFIPFLGTLFIYIWVMNLGGLFPFWFAPTSTLEMTIALAVPVFLYVQFSALRLQGLGGYLHHLAGEPRDAIGWAMVPLIFPLHLIGELAKPASLSLRLFGNVFGEETVIAVFAMLGVTILFFLPDAVPLGIPLHVPFMFLGILLGTIQALVFMLLSTIYFALILPHGHDEH